MKLRLLLFVLSIAALISGCVTSAGYGSSYRGQRVGVGVTYSQGAPYGYGSYGYGTRPGGYGYYGGYDRDSYYRPGYGYYSPGYPYSYRTYPGVPYNRGYHPGIHPGSRYYGQPNHRPTYRGHSNYPRITPPRVGGRPPWRNVRPPSVPRVQPPVEPGSNLAPRVDIPRDETPEARIDRGLRKSTGSRNPLD